MMGRSPVVKGAKKEQSVRQMLLDKKPIRAISRATGFSRKAIETYRDESLPEELVKAKEVEEIAQADGLLDELQKARQRTYDLLDKAEEAASVKVYGAPVQYLREIREQIKLLFELEGRIQSQAQINLTQVNIYDSPAWVRVGDILASILEPYPVLKMEIARRLHALAKEGDKNATVS